MVIPKELRKVFDIKERDPLEIYTDGDKIVLCKYTAANACVITGEISDDNETIMGVTLSPAGKAALKAALK